MIDILGWQFRLAVNDVQTSSIGFIGIAVALLGRNTAVGVGFAALLFGALLNGTSTRNLDPSVFDPNLADNLTLLIQGLVVLFVGADVLVLYLWGARAAAPGPGAGAVRLSIPALPGERIAARRLGEPRSIALVGVGLAALAAFVALPPINAREPYWPAAIGLLAVAAGIWATTRGERKLGLTAVGAGLLGITLGIAATASSTEHLDIVFLWSALVASTLRYATPLTFAAIGGCSRSGAAS